MQGAARLFPWRGVVAPWLLSRVVSIVVLLVAVNDPARGSRFVQVATRWDGAFYLDIARNGYGPVDVPFPKWPFFPLLPGLIRALSEVADDKAAIFGSETSLSARINPGNAGKNGHFGKGTSTGP